MPINDLTDTDYEISLAHMWLNHEALVEKAPWSWSFLRPWTTKGDRKFVKFRTLSAYHSVAR